MLCASRKALHQSRYNCKANSSRRESFRCCWHLSTSCKLNFDPGIKNVLDVEELHLARCSGSSRDEIQALPGNNNFLKNLLSWAVKNYEWKNLALVILRSLLRTTFVWQVEFETRKSQFFTPPKMECFFCQPN